MTTIQITARVKPASPSGLLLPDGEEYVYLEHDDLAQDWKGQRLRAPEVWPLYWVEYSPLTAAWQWYWFRVGLVHPYTGYEHWDETRLASWELSILKAEWRSLTHGEKAFTNNHGTNEQKPDGSNGGRDYISNRNMDSDHLPAQGAITCCGNVFRRTGSNTAKGTPIETLDGRYLPPSIEKVNRLTRPDLIFCAVNIPGYKMNNKEFPLIVQGGTNIGRVQADPFPNLDNISSSKSIDTCVPLRTNGAKSDRTYLRDGVHYAVNYISDANERRLKPLAERVVPTPYVR